MVSIYNSFKNYDVQLAYIFYISRSLYPAWTCLWCFKQNVWISITNFVQIIMCSFVGHRGFCWLSCKRVNTMFGWDREKYGSKPFLKGYILHRKRNKIWMVRKSNNNFFPFHLCPNMSLYTTLKVWQVYDTLYCFIL